ncbi:hypothetical protein HAX54_048359 [Datura stramonium]|uniref:Uncharacterized protein n=1 Tax=Datura stramonium TaxID=4076 RepID=A0ABS8SU61_DATST|nr:hypothetical protein [Datura stramonium]
MKTSTQEQASENSKSSGSGLITHMENTTHKFLQSNVEATKVEDRAKVKTLIVETDESVVKESHAQKTRGSEAKERIVEVPKPLPPFPKPIP